MTCFRWRMAFAALSIAIASTPLTLDAQAGTARCFAAPASMTPSTWAPPKERLPAVRALLRVIGDVPLPGPANRFDYQTIDEGSRRLYLSHMNAGRLVVFDLDSSNVIAEIRGLDRATGVLAVPARHSVYVSAAGLHEVAVIDDRSLKIIATIRDIRFPDGIAYAPTEGKVFVSDESGEAVVAIDAVTNRKRSTIGLGGEAGNTHYDSVSHCIVTAVQTRNQIVAIDPASERIVARYDLAGSDHPHGFAIDESGRNAFVTSEESSLLQVVDLRTMRVTSVARVGAGPDVVAWDASHARLYIASESGRLSVFGFRKGLLVRMEDIQLSHAHTVAVDQRTHRVYLPLENVGGRPDLRILQEDRLP
jgi:DNA-binding beta-propeller fold protein YncE